MIGKATPFATPDNQAFIDLMMDNNLIQISDIPTAASGILDLIFISKDLDISSCKIGGESINLLSNHFSIFTQLSIPNFKSLYMRPGKPNASFSYCNADSENFYSLIVTKPFSRICWSNANVVIEQWHIWIRLFVFQTVPRRKRHRFQLSPWVTQTSSNLIKKPFTVKRNQPGNYEKIKLMQRSCERSIEQYRANFESRLANTRSKSKLFKYFRTFKSLCVPASVSYINEIATDSKSQCRLFSKVFASIFIVSGNFVPVGEVEIEKPLFAFDVSQCRTRSMCENLDATKAVGPAGIPPILFKICAKIISQSMASVFYKIKQTGVFPVCWKRSFVNSTLKKSSKANVENYRQIPLLCIISKLSSELCLILFIDKHTLIL